MRVALVGDEFPPDIGGASIYTHQLAVALAKKGVEVHFITHWHWGEPMESELQGVRIRRVKGFVLPRFNRAISPWSFRRLHDFIKYGEYHVVHGADAYSPLACGGLWSARKRHIPSVFTCHTALTYNPLVTVAHFPILRILRKSTAAITVSPQSKLFCELLGVKPEKIHVIYNGVDLKTFNPQVNGKEFKKRLDIKNARLIVTAARLTPYKQIDLLIQAFKIVKRALPNSALAIAGTGIEIKRLQALTRKLGGGESVFFLGQIPHSEVAKLIGAADLCVIPSRVESFSLFALESLACGKPVIGPARGGIKNLVQQGLTGKLILMNDSSKLANVIIQVLRNRQLRKSAKKYGPQFVRKKFSWNKCAEKTIEVYEKIMVTK